jgi:pimeloyl-ACP methyl ester carboxylesterase
VQSFISRDTTFAYQVIGEDFMTKNPAESKPSIFWAHGWGHSSQNFLPLVTPFEHQANNVVIDFPGFGASPVPAEIWATEDYADAIAEHMKKNNIPPVIWIGHSFGCRVGLQMAARHPECIRALCLIAGAGLKRKRPIHKKIYFFLRIKLFKLLKKIIPASPFKDKIMSKFGSADYKKSGPLRGIFIKTVNEDLSTIATTIKCPVTLIYGQNDTETPPEFGERLSKLIPNSNFFLLGGQDHYSVLSTGRHQVIKIISDILKHSKI